jgi:hypothetical protein
MSKQQVIVEASPDGTVTVETVGVKGPACEKLSEAIEAAIGSQTSNTRKPEFHQQATAVQPAQATQGAG